MKIDPWKSADENVNILLSEGNNLIEEALNFEKNKQFIEARQKYFSAVKIFEDALILIEHEWLSDKYKWQYLKKEVEESINYYKNQIKDMNRALYGPETIIGK